MQIASVIATLPEKRAMVNDVLMVSQVGHGCVLCPESEWNHFKEQKGYCTCEKSDLWEVFKRAILSSSHYSGQVRLVSGDQVGLGHIHCDVTTQFNLDGVDRAFVVQDDERRLFLKFPDHSDRLVPLEAFADNLTTITVVSGQHRVDNYEACPAGC